MDRGKFLVRTYDYIKDVWTDRRYYRTWREAVDAADELTAKSGNYKVQIVVDDGEEA